MKKTFKTFLFLLTVFSIFGFGSLVLAGQNYNISIDSQNVNNLTLSLSGSMNGTYVGQKTDQFIRITDWGDGSLVEDASANFVFGTESNDFSGT